MIIIANIASCTVYEMELHIVENDVFSSKQLALRFDSSVPHDQA